MSIYSSTSTAAVLILELLLAALKVSIRELDHLARFAGSDVVLYRSKESFWDQRM